MSKSYLDNAGVGILSSLMKKAIKDTVESAKDQLFVVTVTPNGPPEEHDAWLTMKYTPSVTFAEAVAQAKSGKKVVIGMGDNLDAYIRMDLISGSDGDDIFLSKDETGFFKDENIKTFTPVLVEHYQWDSNKLCLIVDFTLPKWIGDTKPTYTASEVGAADKPKRVSVTLTASGWNSSAKTQTVTVNGVLADESAQVIQPIPAIASQSAYYAAGILATGQAKDHVTFTAATIPTTNLNIYVVVTELRG